jgi:N-acyl-D-amino-acid deacylase
MTPSTHCIWIGILALAAASPRAAEYDLVIHGGTLFDGSGAPGQQEAVAVRGDRIVAIGNLDPADGRRAIDASGLAVAPGFINMLSWASTSLVVDGRSQSDVRQGVTLEVFGEGSSMGPLTESMRTLLEEQQSTYGLEVEWQSLGEYLEFLERRGVSPNVASFVGATTVRVHELGFEDRTPSAAELDRMRELVREAMREGALGVASALIYAPAFYAHTAELVALAKAAAEHDGMYISHLRGEGNRLLKSMDELIYIAEESGARGEIYHLKMSGRSNWPKYDDVVAKIEAARARGLSITTNMYTYTAGSTGLDAAMPPWVQEGGYQAWAERLRDPAIRTRVAAEMTTPTDAWENLMYAAGPAQTLLVGFRNPELRRYTGMTLEAVAAQRGVAPEVAAMDLVIEDGSRVQVVYFLMDESNVRRATALPWMSFGSDAASLAPEGIFLATSTHPRAYGNFARLLGKYVREEHALPLEDAIYKLTQLPATNLRIRDRGTLAPGYFADIVVFDPVTIADHATYDEPHRYATGMRHVFVNGEQVLRDGEHTGALPGRVVRGPGWRGWND